MLKIASHPVTNEILYQHPILFKAKINSSDSPTLREQILKLPENHPDKAKWYAAMDEEMDELVKKVHSS